MWHSHVSWVASWCSILFCDVNELWSYTIVHCIHQNVTLWSWFYVAIHHAFTFKEACTAVFLGDIALGWGVITEYLSILSISIRFKTTIRHIAFNLNIFCCLIKSINICIIMTSLSGISCSNCSHWHFLSSDPRWWSIICIKHFLLYHWSMSEQIWRVYTTVSISI